MRVAAWYLHKVDQCARLADDACKARIRSKFTSERHAWLQILAAEIEADAATLGAVIELVPSSDDA